MNKMITYLLTLALISVMHTRTLGSGNPAAPDGSGAPAGDGSSDDFSLVGKTPASASAGATPASTSSFVDISALDAGAGAGMPWPSEDSFVWPEEGATPRLNPAAPPFPVAPPPLPLVPLVPSSGGSSGGAGDSASREGGEEKGEGVSKKTDKLLDTKIQTALIARKTRRVYTATTSKFATPAASSSATDFAIASAQTAAAAQATSIIEKGIDKASLTVLFDAGNILALQETLSRLIASGKGADLKRALEDKGEGTPALIERVKSGGDAYMDIKDILKGIGL